jgi:hypothetical protein
VNVIVYVTLSNTKSVEGVIIIVAEVALTWEGILSLSIGVGIVILKVSFKNTVWSYNGGSK